MAPGWVLVPLRVGHVPSGAVATEFREKPGRRMYAEWRTGSGCAGNYLLFGLRPAEGSIAGRSPVAIQVS